jgi:hypothetical protein
MKPGLSVLLGFTFASLLISSMPVSASSFVPTTDDWTPVKPAYYCGGNCSPGDWVVTNYRNNLDVNVSGIVFWVVHNNLGQTVKIGSGTVGISAGSNKTAYAVAFGLPPDSYNSTVFATDFSGVAISRAESFVFTKQ